MKISEVITSLEKVKSSDGDLEVVLFIDGEYSPIIGHAKGKGKTILIDEKRFLAEMNKLQE